MFKVYESACKNCLLSPDRIVSPQRAKQIIKDCTNEQTYFICHKSSSNEDEEGDKICCHTFHKKLGHISQMIRIAERLNMIQFVKMPNSKKLPTYTEMYPKNKT